MKTFILITYQDVQFVSSLKRNKSDNVRSIIGSSDLCVLWEKEKEKEKIESTNSLSYNWFTKKYLSIKLVYT